jgi:hypothetical protein
MYLYVVDVTHPLYARNSKSLQLPQASQLAAAMPKYARNSDIDLDETYGALLDKHAPMRRNIRTKTDMHRTHHCEDKECGGAAPKLKCIIKLHFAFCAAPVVDNNFESPTYGKVVIHGERFAVISPQGCAEHPYRAEYNLDFKNARNDRTNYEIRWKQIFDDFKTEHEANQEREAENLREMQMMMGMTGHQRQTMQARQDNLKYQQRRQLEIANRVRDILDDEQDIVGGVGEAEVLRMSSLTAPSLAVEVARPSPDTRWCIPDELAQRIGEATSQDLATVLRPLWLHDELFGRIDNRRADENELQDWSVVPYESQHSVELPVPTSVWLTGELFPDVDASADAFAISSAKAEAVASEDMEIEQVADIIAVPRPRRKETKLVKKQRAVESRALARTLAEEMAMQVAEEKDLARAKQAEKALMKRGFGRRGLTSFA